MPFKPADNPKCPKCGKSVYAAEEKVAGGFKFHKMCFKCGMCNKMLDSTNCAEHEGELYCKNCHARKYGPKGYGFGGGAGCLSMDTGEHLSGYVGEGARAPMEPRAIAKAPEGEGCPRCGGFVYAAEQMLARGRGWHKECFKCGDCSKRLDSVRVCEGPDKDIYCKACYGKKFGPKGYGYGQGAGALQSDASLYTNGGGEYIANKKNTLNDVAKIQAPKGQGCPRCGGAVFAAEQQLAKGTMWHKKCFNCCDCHRPLDSMLACDGPDKEIYCRACYGKKFGPKGFGYGFAPTLVSTSGESTCQFNDARPTHGVKASGAKGCPRCGFEVYAAEQMISKNRIWHKRCFGCKDCGRSLDSTNLNDGPDNDIYCRGCYGRNFGPKGCGFGIGAGTLTMA